ncbi:Xanthine and CO dehydrogenase maturation factor [Oleispira antarctica RB-8]|uniref:Xanthine and CO dehydrogenase maturation factor n=1 Tax=Oleispira antarctica RB-8 TaxID=698738 RepID=R4YQS6_OLEAN|nr:Xanthine and CO dehydrogenase maturation factor [Oleispira antarctica RB-8]
MSAPKHYIDGKNQWFDAVQSIQHRGDAYALVTVLGCTGSTPRDHSSKMVITAEQTFDTIGGGHLEFLVMKKARAIIASNAKTNKVEQEIHHFPLGASLGQCCGGSATVLIETFAACQFHVAIFGAGHVAKSIVTILSGLACKVSWIDSREDEFPLEIPANVHKIVTAEPCDELADLPNGSDILILTHNHQLDFELCLTALKRNRNPLQQLRSIGLIGSQTKALRFQKRLSDRLLDQDPQTLIKKTIDEQIKSIRCPVGLSSVPGKLPMEVAVSIVGELIAIDHASHQVTEEIGANAGSNSRVNSDNQSRETAKKSRGLAWQEIKQQLNGELDSKGQGTVLHLGKITDVDSQKK